METTSEPLEYLHIQLRDGVSGKAAVFRSGGDPDVVVICLPAMGVRARYYQEFAQKLSGMDCTVITIDWRGLGNSSITASRETDYSYRDFIADLEEWGRLLEKEYPNRTKILVGHSLGGQIGILFASRWPTVFKGLVLVSACSVYYKGWSGLNGLKVLVAGRIFYSISKIFGFFPGHVIGFGGREAMSVMRDWCANALTGTYDHIDEDFHYEEALTRLSVPVLSISIDRDVFAPTQAINNLNKKFSSVSNVQHVHVRGEHAGVPGLNHFNWAKKPDYFVELITNWLKTSFTKT